MRKTFQHEFLKLMQKDKKVNLLVGDLGYKMFNDHFSLFSDRCYNCGASEQSMLGVAVGLALEGAIPFVYSITPFLIYRPFETIRNYIDYESIKVILVGSGRDKDYIHDGFSHWCEEIKQVMAIFKNIETYYPNTKEDIPDIVREVYKSPFPSFISLKR